MYQRYRIAKKLAPHIVPHPHPFKVKINRFALLKHLFKELLLYKGKKKVIENTPCVYGVFSGPIGGFAAREKLCVGCLRCTTQYPHISTILPNPSLLQLANPYMDALSASLIAKEAETGALSVRGAGYRGKFGGSGFDGLWIDMSEIVRPTRDGIYGREYISTEISLGERPSFLCFDQDGQPVGPLPRSLKIPFPILFDTLPNACYDHPHITPILVQAAKELKTFAVLPLSLIQKFKISSHYAVPSIHPEQFDQLQKLLHSFHIIELTQWHRETVEKIKLLHPAAVIILKCPFDAPLIDYYKLGCRLFHLTAEEEGYNRLGTPIVPLIQQAHLSFVKEKVRDQVTLIGCGGIVAAEHIPKSLLLGLDAVALRSSLLVALQAKLSGDGAITLPRGCKLSWGVQRIKNLMHAWQDLLFEAAGAMGIREVRRMRGESGRLLFQKKLESEAFSGIEGYDR